ncbi:nardilysin-like [Primulina huaijiensis]|uniref:nardilysin-like n=1 Tax=Primulina huaijiensis TaxID=1492673 RepID=UPI003CC6E73A
MAVRGGAISSDDVVIKSPADRRLYRYIELANGLCALLVHDPEIYSDQPYVERKLGGSEEDEDEDENEDEEEDDEDFGEGDSEEEDDVEEEEEKVLKGSLQKKAAAAMCVGLGTGSFKDPYEAQGLSHFLGLICHSCLIMKCYSIHLSIASFHIYQPQAKIIELLRSCVNCN